MEADADPASFGASDAEVCPAVDRGEDVCDSDGEVSESISDEDGEADVLPAAAKRRRVPVKSKMQEHHYSVHIGLECTLEDRRYSRLLCCEPALLRPPDPMHTVRYWHCYRELLLTSR